MRMKLHGRLLAWLLTFALIPLLTAVILLSSVTRQALDELAEDRRVSIARIVEGDLKQTSEELLELAELLGADPALVRAVERGDRTALAQAADPLFARMQLEHGFAMLEFGGKDGRVLYRAHNPAEFGDDKSGKPAVAAALSGEALSGLEFGSSGLAVRAFVPLQSNGAVVGTLQTGLDGSFARSMAERLNGIELTIWDADGAVALASRDTPETAAIADTALLEAVLAGKERQRKEGDHQRDYMPLRDPTGQQVIGMIGIGQDLTAIGRAESRIERVTLLLGGVTVIVALLASYYVSRTIAGPVKRVAAAMQQIASGNLAYAFKGDNRSDELGDLMQAAVETQVSLSAAIGQAGDTSRTVSATGDELLAAANAVSGESEKAAASMQQLTAGIEELAAGTAELAENIGAFDGELQAAAGDSAHLAEVSDAVRQTAERGSGRMQASLAEMKVASELVRQAHRNVAELERQAEQITELVGFIQGVADQTHLLALNAAIEAARAGEQGKGFAVVAGEVRKLAEQASQSVMRITAIVAQVQSDIDTVAQALEEGRASVDSGAAGMVEAGETFDSVRASVAGMADRIAAVTGRLASITERSAAIRQWVDNAAAVTEQSSAAVSHTSASVQETAASMEHVADSARRLAEAAERMNGQIERFKLE